MLELQDLTRRYGDLVALDDLSFTVREGQLFGFVGPNRASRTTAIGIILGVLAPDAGQSAMAQTPMTDGDVQTRRTHSPGPTAKRSLHCSLVSQEYERRRLVARQS